MYMIKVNGMTEKLCRSFAEAKKYAKKRNGKVYVLRNEKLPKASKLSYGDSERVKREMYSEIYSENNHGYHFTRPRRHAG